MADIAFILLIFLIVTSSYQKTHRQKLDLPRAHRSQPLQKKDTLEFYISHDNRIFINGSPVTLAKIRTTLPSEQQCIITGDRKASFRLIHQIIDIVREKKYARVFFTIRRKKTLSRAELF